MSTLPIPSSAYPDLASLFNRAYAKLPSPASASASASQLQASGHEINGNDMPAGAITHLLHLSPEGEILGHVDNTEASGGVILGVCLGADRILRLSEKHGSAGSDPSTSSTSSASGVSGWDVLLRNGTMYLQR